MLCHENTCTPMVFLYIFSLLLFFSTISHQGVFGIGQEGLFRNIIEDFRNEAKIYLEMVCRLVLSQTFPGLLP